MILIDERRSAKEKGPKTDDRLPKKKTGKSEKKRAEDRTLKQIKGRKIETIK